MKAEMSRNTAGCPAASAAARTDVLIRATRRKPWAALLVLATCASGACRARDSNAWIKQTGTTALTLAAAGFDGSFDAVIEPSSKLYLLEGVGADFAGTRLAVHGKMDARAVSVETLDRIVELLERMSAIPTSDTPGASR